MAKLQFIDAVQTDDLVRLQDLIDSRANVNEQDEHGWTALNWAAGKGNPAIVQLLVNNGADVFNAGRDQRTPYTIALAAGHVEVLDILQNAEVKIAGQRSQREELKYCRAFPVGQLRQFVEWSAIEENPALAGRRALTNEEFLFVHHDYSVTDSMWHNENVILDQPTSAWKEFCTNELGFTVPNEIELIRSNINESFPTTI
ncbi:MAG TPA: ankyrin repeat domain-containing protein [Pyrinomonadaceae bacterium]|nr:ankyrin repeat domain-containing protein [Pyrinomonadaceae bacterium]